MLHLLKLKRNYTNLLTAFLLILYTFIATPVSLWHHHKSAGDKNYSEQDALVVKESNASADASCKICAYHYYVTLNDAIFIYFFPLTDFDKVGNFCFSKKILNPSYFQYNKGPPAKA